MSQSQPQRAIPQSKEALLKSYTLRLKEDIKSMLDNFTEVIKLARVEEESQISRSTQAEQDQYEMQVRAANIVRAVLILNLTRDKMASMQAAMKELRTLKQEENSMVNLASKISDQLNRLKVEELALQNLVRLQNEELERKSRGSQRSINRSLPVDEAFEDSEDESNDVKEYLEKGDKIEKMENGSIIPLNLVVNKYHEHEPMEEEEDDDDDEDDGGKTKRQAYVASDDCDIEKFVSSL